MSRGFHGSRDRSADIAQITSNIQKLRAQKKSIVNDIVIRHLEYHLRELQQKHAWHKIRYLRHAVGLAGAVFGSMEARNRNKQRNKHTKALINNRLKVAQKKN